MTRVLSFVLFQILALGGGLLIGITNRPGEWYRGLVKPPFNPPDWLFAPAWTLLYIVIGFVGWRCLQASPTGRRMQLWWAQLILNFLWMPLFFGLQQMTLALFVIVMLLLVILAFINMTRDTDRLSALFFVPYAAWVAFATYLNIGLLALN